MRFIFAILLLAFASVSNGESASVANIGSAITPLNTVHWYDLNWSKRSMQTKDFMVLTGKLFVSPNWPESLKKPNNALFRIHVSGDNGIEPIVIMSGINVNGARVELPLAFEVGKQYEFAIYVKGRRPGVWLIGPEIVLDEKNVIYGPEVPITIQGPADTSLFPTPKAVSELLRNPVTSLTSENLPKDGVKVEVEKASFSEDDQSITAELKVENSTDWPIRLGEIAFGGARFLDSSVLRDTGGYPEYLLYSDGLAVEGGNIFSPHQVVSVNVVLKGNVLKKHAQAERDGTGLLDGFEAFMHFFNDQGIRHLARVEINI